MNNKSLMSLAEYKRLLNAHLDELIAKHGPDRPVVTFDEVRKQYSSEPLFHYHEDEVAYYLLNPKSDWRDKGANDAVPVICLGR